MQKVVKILLYEDKIKKMLKTEGLTPDDIMIKVDFNPLVVDGAETQEKTKSDKSARVREEAAAGLLTKAEARHELYPDSPPFDAVKKTLEEDKESEQADGSETVPTQTS